MERYEVSDALLHSTQLHPSPMYSIPSYSTIIHICSEEARLES